MFKRNTQQSILKKESVIYREIYQQVADEVESYSQRHKLDLVIRFNADPLPEDDPQQLIQNMNRIVVFQRDLDISSEILEILNAKLDE